jgi:hypothetical protein
MPLISTSDFDLDDQRQWQWHRCNCSLLTRTQVLRSLQSLVNLQADSPRNKDPRRRDGGLFSKFM